MFRVLSFLAVLLGAAHCLAVAAAPARRVPPTHVPSLPLVFEPAGGFDYVARRPGYSLHLSRGEARVEGASGAVRIRFRGANPRAAAEGLGKQAGRVNYFLGADASRWRRGVPAFTRVRYREIYPGVDLDYYGSGSELEYDLIVAPGADPERILLDVEGRGALRVDASGDLVLGRGALRLRTPVLYQEVDGVRREIAGGYTIRGRNRAGFQVGAYDRTKPLIIDPVLVFATFLGGSGSENLPGASDDVTTASVAVDPDGNIYVAGNTLSANFPTANPLQAAGAGNVDAYVAKLDPSGSKLLYCTYLGGSDLDRPFGLAVDAAGSAYVAGRTHSSNFPTTGNAFQRNLNSYEDGFVAKLSPDGGSLVYATFLGGTKNDDITAIAVDASGAAYVTGETQSTDFPLANPAQARLGGYFDGFVTKLNPQGSGLVYSTYLGGVQGDDVRSVAVDRDGNAYVTGYTNSTDFPTLNPIQAALAGSNDAFIAKLDPKGALVYSTYFGGSGTEWGLGIAVDPSGSAYVTGFTTSTNFPVTSAAEQRTLAGPQDAFLVKLNPAGSAASYSSYFGGGGSDIGVALGFDVTNTLYMAGVTNSTTYQNYPGAVQPMYGGGSDDGFLARFDRQSLRMDYFTYFGGGADDVVVGLAVDVAGNAHLTGTTASADLAVTGQAVQRAYGGGTSDGFLAKIATLPTRLLIPLPATSYSRATGFAPESLVAAFGESLCGASAEAPAGALPTQLAGCSVMITDSAGASSLAPLTYVGSWQVNFVVPAETAPGTAAVAVIWGGSPVAMGAMYVERVGPGLFTANANGMGAAAAWAIRVAADGERTSQLTAECGATPGSCAAAPIDLGPETDQVFLELYGSGIRGRQDLQGVSVAVGGIAAEVLYAGAQGSFPGLDQVNVRLPRSLAGHGVVDMALTVDGRAANTVQVAIK